MKKIIKFILLLLWMYLIFYFSNQNGADSSATSDGLVMSLVKFIDSIFPVDFSEETMNTMAFIIRKVAHYTLYFVLGILIFELLNEHSMVLSEKVIYSIMFCLIYACSDEIHQLFVDGRDGKIFDVFVDMFGSLSSIFCFYLFHKYKKTS